jgi:hypothetical protein
VHRAKLDLQLASTSFPSVFKQFREVSRANEHHQLPFPMAVYGSGALCFGRKPVVVTYHSDIVGKTMRLA